MWLPTLYFLILLLCKRNETVIIAQWKFESSASSYERSSLASPLPSLVCSASFMAHGDGWPWIPAAPVVKIVLIVGPTEEGVLGRAGEVTKATHGLDIKLLSYTLSWYRASEAAPPMCVCVCLSLSLPLSLPLRSCYSSCFFLKNILLSLFCACVCMCVWYAHVCVYMCDMHMAFGELISPIFVWVTAIKHRPSGLCGKDCNCWATLPPLPSHFW